MYFSYLFRTREKGSSTNRLDTIYHNMMKQKIDTMILSTITLKETGFRFFRVGIKTTRTGKDIVIIIHSVINSNDNLYRTGLLHSQS